MVRVADYIVSFISDRLGIKDVFMLAGAGIMHLTDAVARNTALRAICVHHEQSASMALEAYARANEHFGVGIFTTGPGSTNAITGLAGAWQDTVPCLFISGNVRRSELTHTAAVPGLRQFGVQELDIIPIVSSITKYAITLTDPQRVRYEFEKAFYIATTGRPGPVWIDVPLDVQATTLADPKQLESFVPPKNDTPALDMGDIGKIKDLLITSQRPVIIAGRGVRLSGACELLERFATSYSIPVVTPYLGIDNLNHNLDIYIGKVGIKGDRPANFTVQNADLVIAIGTSLHVSVIGYDYKQFARAARKVVIDVDRTAHLKSTIDIDMMIEADAKGVLSALLQKLNDHQSVAAPQAWLARCARWKHTYPVTTLDGHGIVAAINLYTFINRLSAFSAPGDIFIADAGSAFYAVSQAIRLTKDGQRYIPSGAMATMGYSLPAAIGAAAALPNRRVLAITGDGSFQQNLQELQTLLQHGFAVKLFVINNDGYLSIRASQNKYFEGRLIGEGPASGVTMPDTLRICEAYGIAAERISTLASLDDVLRRALEDQRPFVVEVITPRLEPIVPTVASKLNSDGSMSSRPLEDMEPLLPRDEYRYNLIVDEFD
jgi:acetolactate synthase-1/2/3 large subunit